MTLTIDPEFQALIPPLTQECHNSEDNDFFYQIMWSNAHELKAYLRENTPHSVKQACCVCNKNMLIAEAHHLFPLSILIEFIQKHHLYFLKLPMDIVLKTAWLCPNHHAIYHAFNRKTPLISNEAIEFLKELTEDERSKLNGLFDIAHRNFSTITSLLIKAKGDSI